MSGAHPEGIWLRVTFKFVLSLLAQTSSFYNPLYNACLSSFKKIWWSELCSFQNAFRCSCLLKCQEQWLISDALQYVCLSPDDIPGSRGSLQHRTLPGHTHSYSCLLTRCIYLVQGSSLCKPSVQITFRPFGIFTDKWYFLKKKGTAICGLTVCIRISTEDIC